MCMVLSMGKLVGMVKLIHSSHDVLAMPVALNSTILLHDRYTGVKIREML